MKATFCAADATYSETVYCRNPKCSNSVYQTGPRHDDARDGPVNPQKPQAIGDILEIPRPDNEQPPEPSPSGDRVSPSDIIRGYDAFLLDDPPAELIKRFAPHGYEPLHVWAATIMAAKKKRPVAYFCSVLNGNAKYPLNEEAIEQARQGLKKYANLHSPPRESSEMP